METGQWEMAGGLVCSYTPTPDSWVGRGRALEWGWVLLPLARFRAFICLGRCRINTTIIAFIECVGVRCRGSVPVISRTALYDGWRLNYSIDQNSEV